MIDLRVHTICGSEGVISDGETHCSYHQCHKAIIREFDSSPRISQRTNNAPSFFYSQDTEYKPRKREALFFFLHSNNNTHTALLLPATINYQNYHKHQHSLSNLHNLKLQTTKLYQYTEQIATNHVLPSLPWTLYQPRLQRQRPRLVLRPSRPMAYVPEQLSGLHDYESAAAGPTSVKWICGGIGTGGVRRALG